MVIISLYSILLSLTLLSATFPFLQFPVLTSCCLYSDLSISAKQFLFIEFKIGNKVHKRPMSLDMPRQLIYYDCGLLSSYESNRRDTLDEFQFTSSSSFDLITGEATQAGMSYNKIQGTNTAIYHFLFPSRSENDSLFD